MNHKLKAGNIELIVAVGAGILALLAIVLGVAYRPGTTTVVDSNGQVREVPLGATPGADRYNDQECTQGFCHYYYHRAMTRATSTPCAFLSPNATSTLVRFTANISSSTAVTATTYTLATSTTQYATTSLISFFGAAGTLAGTTTIASAAQGALVWSSSPNQVGLISPNTYLVLGVQGGTGNFGTAAQVGGVCNATFDSVN